MSSPVIKLKRGAYADLPTLGVGEPGFTTDRYQLFVGSHDGNKIIGGGEFWNLNSTTVGGGIKVYEATNNGTNFIELRSPAALAASITYLLPGADGAADQVLKTDGSGNLTFAAVNTLTNAGLDSVVEDTTPQLGGNLDLNSNDIDGTGNIDITGNVIAQSAINAQTGSSYTLVLGDASKLVTMSNGSGNTLTVPPNSSVAFPVGTKIDIASLGNGQTTVAQGAGVTINTSSTLLLRAQYSGATCIKTATNTWLLVGDLAAS